MCRRRLLFTDCHTLKKPPGSTSSSASLTKPLWADAIRSPHFTTSHDTDRRGQACKERFCTRAAVLSSFCTFNYGRQWMSLMTNPISCHPNKQIKMNVCLAVCLCFFGPRYTWTNTSKTLVCAVGRFRGQTGWHDINDSDWTGQGAETYKGNSMADPFRPLIPSLTFNSDYCQAKLNPAARGQWEELLPAILMTSFSLRHIHLRRCRVKTNCSLLTMAMVVGVVVVLVE